MLKSIAIVFVQMWLRWTLPRPRIDQVLYACVKVMFPAACVLLLGAAIWPMIVPDYAAALGQYNPWSLTDWNSADRISTLATQTILALIGVAVIGSVVVWVLMAWMRRGDVVPRLSEPAPIEEAA